MRRSHLWRMLALWLLLSGLLTACKPSTFTLHLHFKKGDVFHVKMDTTQHMRQTIMGQDIKVNQQMLFEYTWEVTNVDAAGDATIEVTYDRLALTQEQNGEKRAYDSASGEEPPDFFKGVDLLVGKSFQVVLAPDGSVKSLTGLEEMLRQVADEMGLGKGETDAFYESLLGGFGDQAMTEQFGAFFPPYPHKPLKVGSAWDSDVTLKVFFPLNVHTTYTVQSWQGNQVTLKMASTIKTNPSKTTTPPNSPFAVRYEITGTQEGTSLIDLTTGMLTHSEVNQHLEGKVLLLDPQHPEDTQNAMTMPLTMESTTTVTVQRGK